MFWVAFKGYNNGKAISLGAVEQLEAEAYGMHGYPTEALAEAHPNIVPAIAKAQVNGWIFNAQGSATSHLQSHLPNPVKGAVTGVEDFLSRLTSINTWIRIGEFVLGAMLILAGALKLSGSSSDIKDIAGTVVRYAK